MKKTPVEKNREYIIDIVSETNEGMGVGKIEGYTIFVDEALMGEKVKIKIVKVLKNYSYGKLLEIIEKSPYRIEPQCPAIKRCGGCQMQHINYEGQLQYKTRIVKEVLERIGGLKDIVIHDTIGMEKPWNYRNKAQFPVQLKDGKVNIGFFAPRSHEVVDINKCMIQDKISDKVLETLRNFIKKYDISIYDENTGKGLIRHIMIRKGYKTGEVMVCIIINGERIPNQDILVDTLKQNIEGLKTIVLNINKKTTNVIMGEKNLVLYGDGYIYDYIGDFKFKISPLSFFQVNPIQTEILYNKALEYANLTGEETVIDAYCGIGTISLFMSQRAKFVYGVEIVGQAIEDAKENARINDINNVEFIHGESEVVIPKLYEQGIKADVIVVDPPRKGCDEKLLEAIVNISPKRMVYVSCNPATLARDLKYLESE